MIYVVRHGETIWNRARRRQGHDDSPLTLRGIQQAMAFGERLRHAVGVNIQELAIVSSPLGRARQTASIICESMGLDPNDALSFDPLLAEHNFGAWEGLKDEEIELRFPGALEQRRGDPWNYLVPEGERYADLFERASRWLGQPRPRRITVAVTHAMTSRALRGAYLELSRREMQELLHTQDRIFRLDAGRVSELLCATGNAGAGFESPPPRLATSRRLGP